MELFKKINFKQPKYMLPAILYFPLVGLGWLVIDMFQTDTSKQEVSDLVKMDELNTELPEARVNDLGSKKDNMLRSFGSIKDETALRELGRDSTKLEEFKTKYTDEELAEIETKMEEAKQAVVEMKGAVYEGVVVEVNGKRWVATERAVGVKVKDDENGLKIDHI